MTKEEFKRFLARWHEALNAACKRDMINVYTFRVGYVLPGFVNKKDAYSAGALRCFPGYVALANEARVSVRCAIDAVPALELAHLIDIEHRGRGKGGRSMSNFYTLKVPAWFTAAEHKATQQPTAKPSASAGNSGTPPVKTSEPAKPRNPKTWAELVPYLRTWLNAESDIDAIKARWESAPEKVLRETCCGGQLEAFAECKRLLEQRLSYGKCADMEDEVPF